MNVSVSNGQNFSVKVKKEEIKVQAIGGVQVPANFADLEDFDASNLSTIPNNGIIVYNASTKKYELASADQVLSISVSDSSLPNDFKDQLDTDLDNRIDLDGGSF